MDLIPIECGHCNAKLKIKASPARMPVSVKCPKCGKQIPLGKKPATETPAAAPVAATPPPKPVTPPPAATVPAASPTPPPPPTVTAEPPAAVPSPAPAASITTQLTPPPVPAATTTAKKAAPPIVLSHLNETTAGEMITAKCPACQWQTKVAANLAGKKIRCKQCSAIILVETTESAITQAPSPVVETKPEPVPVLPPVLVAPPPAPAAPIAPATPAVRQPTAPLPSATTTISPGTTAAINEIADLKIRLDSARHEKDQINQRLNEIERRAQIAETRAQNAERALHDLAGKHAVENIAATQKIADLDAKVAELNHHLAVFRTDFATELETAEKRVAFLREMIAKAGT